MTIIMPLEHTYADELDGLYLPWQGSPAPAPALVELNEALACELGLSPEELRSAQGVAVLAAGASPQGARPIAQAYAGHQFGGFSPLLGDGRALLLGELIDRRGQRQDLQLKGSGRTPFSRGGDGKATLGPMLRELLFGEFMHACGVPTTRALAVVTTGEPVWRDGQQPGAVLARVASSHLRVGTFELFASRGDLEKLSRLTRYAVARHDPELLELPAPQQAMGLLRAVIRRQASLIAKWVALGFVHGVMNTDNVTISGESIDYGPCAFIDAYDPRAVFSSIDHQGRYAYLNQPRIGLWNMARFAEALLPMLDPQQPERAIAPATDEVQGFMALYEGFVLEEHRRKLGLSALPERQDQDEALIASLLQIMEQTRADHTLTFRALAQVARGDEAAALKLTQGSPPAALLAWRAQWLERLALEPGGAAQAAARMDEVNPLYIPRNHRVERALSAAVDRDDLAPTRELLALLRAPTREVPGHDEAARPAPDGEPPHVTFCGT